MSKSPSSMLSQVAGLVAILTFCVIVGTQANDRLTQEPVENVLSRGPLITIDIEPYLETGPGVPTPFPVRTISHGDEVIRVEVDFESDGRVDWTGIDGRYVEHTFSSPGKYKVTTHVHTSSGIIASRTVTILVSPGVRRPRLADRSKSDWRSIVPKRRYSTQSASTTDRYALIIQDPDPIGGYHYRAALMNRNLRNVQGYTDANIVWVGKMFSCQYDGDSVYIDYAASQSGVDSAMADIASWMDDSDVLHIFQIGHGTGNFTDSVCLEDSTKDYLPFFDYSWGKIIADSAGHPDNFTVESAFNYIHSREGGTVSGMVGINQWAGFVRPGGFYWRNKKISQFDSLLLQNGSIISDTDIFVEEFRYYLKGDTNNDLKISGFEVFDFDGDGNLPIDTSGGEYIYDEDDWSLTPVLVDNKDWSSSSYGAILVDTGHDGIPEIHVGNRAPYDPIFISAIDSNNDGLVTGIDVNRDGDLSDSVASTESATYFSDGELAAWLDSLDYKRVAMTMAACFGGGFINNCSRDDVIIVTGTVETTVGYNHAIIFGAVDAWDGTMEHVQDADSNGCISYFEMFEWYYPTYQRGDRFRLDDNGDGVGSEGPLSGDGDLAALTSLTSEECQPCIGCVGGDANGDCLVNNDDLQAIMDYLFVTFVPVANPEGADVSGNGTVDLTDYSLINSAISAGTTDSLTCGPSSPPPPI